MAEKKGVGHAYNVDFLNVVFAASSIFLFFAVIWMVWDDFDREWKNAQRRFAQLDYQVAVAQRDAANRAVDRAKLGQLNAAGRAARQSVAQNRSKVDDLQKKVTDADNAVFTATLDYNYAKATYDQDRYDFEASRASFGAEDSSVKAKGEKSEQERVKLAELNLGMERAIAKKAEAQKELDVYTGQLGTIRKQIDELTGERTRLAKRAQTAAPSALKDYFRNAPLLDFMAPTIKVQQLILPNVMDDVNFIRVQKMDRCTTCHLAIDKKGYEKYPQPFTTHPNLDQYLGGASPHPIDRVGCTVCHEGSGQSISFKEASHMPRDEKQKAEWEEKHGWEQPHEWDYPMLPTNMTEASCAKCHKQQVYVPNADALNVAYATYERAGCYACHKTKGFDTNMRKPGPILTKIDSKLTQDWVKTWIRNPRAVKPTTWMPRFFNNSNNSSPEDALRSEAEINGIVAYLFANSDKYEFDVKTPPKGDAKNGEKLVKSIGCQGCHVVGEGERDKIGPRRTFGQPLENLGNKTTFEWIFDWVRNPKHYNPGTYMPNLRLTDAQAADVAAYLSGLKSAGGDAAKANADAKATDDTLLDYLKNVSTADDATAQLAKLNPQQRQIELGRRAINRYGCFSCHDIKGFENAQSIGTDLSEEGTKLVTRLDFAFISDIPHSSKLGWFKAKLHDPRVFDKGRVLAPLDKLRMPNFDLSEEEITRLTTAIMSFQREIQPAAAMPVRSARYDYQTAGRTLVNRRNCVGCHVIEGHGPAMDNGKVVKDGDSGDFLALVADPSLGPPLLKPEGVRVQSDWLYAFLRGPIQIRPWLDVHMPTFGLDDANLNGVIHYFQAVSNTLEPFRTYDTSTPATPAGKALFEELKCQKCHVLGEIPKDQPTSNLAPDLRMVWERLNPEWLMPWLKNPASFLPGTRMTQFWPDYPKSPYPDFGGDADAQMKAVIAHISSLRGGPSPKTPAGNKPVTTNNN